MPSIQPNLGIDRSDRTFDRQAVHGVFSRFSQCVAAMSEASPTDLKFETALAALEQIVRDMESGELPLEESIAAYRRGAELLKHCRHLLADAEQQVRVLEEVDDTSAAIPQERP